MGRSYDARKTNRTMDGKTYLSKGADTQVLPQYKLSYLDRSLFHGQSWSRTSLIDLRSVMDDMCWLGYVWRSTRSKTKSCDERERTDENPVWRSRARR